MSTKLNKSRKVYHLSASARRDLFNLREACQSMLELDEFGFENESDNLFGLFPRIYRAFIHIWCRKSPVMVKSSSVARCGFRDVRNIMITYESYCVLYRAFHNLPIKED